MKKRMSRREFLKVGGAAAAAGLTLSSPLLTSCTVPATPTAPAAGPTAKPTVATAKGTETLTIALDTFGQESWLIHKATTLPLGPQSAVFEHLLYPSQDDIYGIVPGLAESWSTEDSKEWIFKIRPGVPWDKDQGEVTAEDVAFSLRLLASDESKVPAAPYLRDRVNSMEVVDSHTLRFSFDTIEADLAINLRATWSCAITSKKYMDSVGEDVADREPVGSGPYRLASHELGTRIELEAVEWPHWRVDPMWGRMVFLSVPETSTRLAMTETERADLALISLEQIEEAADRGFRVLTADQKSNFALTFGGLFRPGHPQYQPNKPFQDVRVREAMNIAIDREAIDNTFFAGLGTFEPMSVFNVAPPNTVADMPIPFDPDRARSLIKEAGVEGYSFEVASYLFPGTPQTPQVMEVLASYWEAVGLKPEISPMEFLTMRERWIEDDTHDTVFAWNGSIGPGTATAFEKFFWSQNVGFQVYTDEFLDSVFEQLKTTGAPDERARLLASAQVHLRENWACLSITNTPKRAWAARPTVGAWPLIQAGDGIFWEYIAPA